MPDEITRVDVAITVVFCGQRLLTVYNDAWGAFTLPATKLRYPKSGSVAGGLRWERGEEAALRNVAEFLHTTSTDPPGLLMDVADLRQSDRDGQVKHYAFQVFGYEVDQPEAGRGVAAEWLTAEEILDEDRGPISPTARTLTRKLQEASLSREGRFPAAMTRPAKRSSVASIAIISRVEAGQKKWLSQWNNNWQRYFLVGGHQQENEIPEKCIRRELQEELQLDQHAHYELYLRKPLSYEAWSTNAWQVTQYEIHTFDVELKDHARAKFASDPANRWLSADEIQSERCTDDKLISPTARTILERSGELPRS